MKDFILYQIYEAYETNVEKGNDLFQKDLQICC